MSTKRSARFATAARHTYRLELVLDFTEPVTGIRAREVARRILDGLHLATEQTRVDADLWEAQIVCHALGRILPREGATATTWQAPPTPPGKSE